MDAIRRPQQGDLDITDVRSATGDRLSISIEKINHDLDPLFDEYPFDSQTEYKGTLEYTEVHPIEAQSETIEKYSFIYRADSGLFFIYEEELGYGMPLFEVIRRFNSSLKKDRLAAPSFPREALWSFAFEADVRPKMTVYDLDGNEYNFEDEPGLSPAQLVENYILDQATLEFEYNGVDDQDEDPETITVEYSEGSISFVNEDTSSGGRDYVLQQVERFLLAGEISDTVEDLLQYYE